MRAMNGLTHNEVSTLNRRLELEEAASREAMHHEFTLRVAEGSADRDGAQYHETTDDDAIVDVLNDSSVARMTRFADALAAVEHSLQAIRDGRYGACLECGRHIGFKRLSANPTSTLCTPCQARLERGTKHPSL
jgi:DnaK suppressor protein